MNDENKFASKTNSDGSHDPYKLHTLEQILTIINQGEFIKDFMMEHANLKTALLDHLESNKNASGSISLKLSYTARESGDLEVLGSYSTTLPKKPPSSGVAYLSAGGNMSLFSPMMRQMQGGVRDVNITSDKIKDVFEKS